MPILLLIKWLSFFYAKQTRNNSRITFFQYLKSESEKELVLWQISLNTNSEYKPWLLEFYSFSHLHISIIKRNQSKKKNDLNTKKNDRNNFASTLKIIVQVSRFLRLIKCILCVCVVAKALIDLI